MVGECFGIGLCVGVGEVGKLLVVVLCMVCIDVLKFWFLVVGWYYGLFVVVFDFDVGLDLDVVGLIGR